MKITHLLLEQPLELPKSNQAGEYGDFLFANLTGTWVSNQLFYPDALKRFVDTVIDPFIFFQFICDAGGGGTFTGRVIPLGASNTWSHAGVWPNP